MSTSDDAAQIDAGGLRQLDIEERSRRGRPINGVGPALFEAAADGPYGGMATGDDSQLSSGALAAVDTAQTPYWDFAKPPSRRGGQHHASPAHEIDAIVARVTGHRVRERQLLDGEPEVRECFAERFETLAIRGAPASVSDHDEIERTSPAGDDSASGSAVWTTYRSRVRRDSNDGAAARAPGAASPRANIDTSQRRFRVRTEIGIPLRCDGLMTIRKSPSRPGAKSNRVAAVLVPDSTLWCDETTKNATTMGEIRPRQPSHIAAMSTIREEVSRG